LAALSFAICGLTALFANLRWQRPRWTYAGLSALLAAVFFWLRWWTPETVFFFSIALSLLLHATTTIFAALLLQRSRWREELDASYVQPLRHTAVTATTVAPLALMLAADWQTLGLNAGVTAWLALLWMALAWERLLLAFLQRMVPSVTDIHFPPEWVFHQSAIISLENPQPGMVRNISSRFWALPWFASARILVFVTGAAPLAGLACAAWRTINLTDFTTDIFHDTITGRVAIDATGCRLSRPEVRISTETAALVTRRWKEYMHS
jgi:hypothetical protein